MVADVAVSMWFIRGRREKALVLRRASKQGTDNEMGIMRIRKVRTVAAVLTVAALPAASGSLGLVQPAGADPVHVASGAFHCGDTVVLNPLTPVQLTANVGPCPTGLTLGGLIVQGSGTLDLNGWWIIGTGHNTGTTGLCQDAATPTSGPGDETGDGSGIYVSSATGVTITNSAEDGDRSTDNGGVRFFDAGITIDGGSGNTIDKVHVDYNKGVGATGTDFGDGIVLRATTANTVKRNIATCNGPYGGITLYAASGNTIGGASGNGNLIEDNAVKRTPTVGEDSGIRVENGSNANVISYNTVNRSGLDGIAVFNPGTGNRIEANDVRDNVRHGIAVFGSSNTITGNNSSGHNSPLTDYDLFESGATSTCSNTWSGNTATRENKACIS